MAYDIPNAETMTAIDDVNNERNLSQTFHSVADLMEDLKFCPEAPDSINADLMTTSEVWAAIQKGVDDVKNGKLQDASTAFANFRDCHRRT